ncbi:MAG TPA: hydantoinase/oxoprolinase family protein [Dehalococcoidia bacterium]|nr:hydantoinase/oxoprolinase family protein [Dehalococcoidia bacterium]
MAELQLTKEKTENPKVRASINVDIGGTFTDCLITYGAQIVFGKAPTTTYDLSKGFMQALRETVVSLDMSLEELLESTEMVRYSTTLAVNRLIERKGPRLGLFTTEGWEDTLPAGRGGSWGDGIAISEMRRLPRMKKPEPIVPRHMVVGIKERIDYKGDIVRPLDEEDVLEKLRYLVNQGAQGFVVCLINSYTNPIHERKIRDLIKRQYPESYLGSMIVVISSDVSPRWREYPRMVATMLCAYLQRSMADELKGMSDELRNSGYKRAMMMVHNSGGMAEVFRTTALNTFNGGPSAGIIGAAYVGKQQGYPNIIATDMGGTSFDVGLVVNDNPSFFQYHPVIERWAVELTMLESKSIGAGGGSIASVDRLMGNKLSIGPRSAGSMPGPACYDLGGTEPTVTDADVVLGYVNPNYFHGGKMKLDKEKAANAIRRRIARPLQIEVEEAAWLIKKIVDGNMAGELFKETILKGRDPKEFVVFALGGAGPTHCCGYTFEAGVPKILTFPASPVFCALGSAVMDVIQYYEATKYILLKQPSGIGGAGTGQYFTDYESFNEVVESLQKRAVRDLEGQGINPELAVFSLELEMRYGGQLNMTRISSPRLYIHNEEDVHAVYEQFEKEFIEAYSALSVFPEGGVDISSFILRSTFITPTFEMPRYPLKSDIVPSEANKGKREAYWQELGGYIPTDTYELSLLEAGNKIEGPAIIEASDTNIVLPPGRTFTINEYMSGIIV